MKYKLIGLLISGIAVTMSCTNDAPTLPDSTGIAEDATLAKRGEANPRPFKARLEGQSAEPGDPNRCNPLITVGLEGTGNATHLGRFTAVQSQCIDPTNPGVFTDGQFVWTAANGDEVHGTYAGELIPTNENSLFLIENPFFFNGGTGRFENAAGGGHASGRVNLGDPAGPFSIEFNGTIIY